jgi:hypothetical protein
MMRKGEMRMECRWQQPQLCNSLAEDSFKKKNSLAEVYESRQRVDSMYLWRRRSKSDGQWRHDPSRVLNSVVSWCLNMAASEFDAEDEALHWLLTGFCRSAKQIPFNWFASKQINHSKHAEVRGLEPIQEGNSQQMARALNPSSDPEAASAFSRDPTRQWRASFLLRCTLHKVVQSRIRRAAI